MPDDVYVLERWNICAGETTVPGDVGKASPGLPREGNCRMQLESIQLASISMPMTAVWWYTQVS